MRNDCHLSFTASGQFPVGSRPSRKGIVLRAFGISQSQSLVRSVRREGLAVVSSFAIRRVRRLLPGMIGFLVGGFLLNLLFKSAGYSEILWASFAAVTGWYNFHQCYGSPLVLGFGGIWSLSLEEQFYMSSVAVVLLCRFLGKKIRSMADDVGRTSPGGGFFLPVGGVPEDL